MTNKPNGVLYIGVTSNLPKRDYEHKQGACDSFTKRHNLNKLVYYEAFDTIEEAIRREKQLKKYVRYRKTELIEKLNPTWNDLSATLMA